MRAKIIGALCAAIGICGVAAIPASASVSPSEASYMCALTYDLGKTSTPVAEYDSPTNGQWVNQDRFIAVARGGSYTASTTSNTTNGSGSSSNIAPCHLDYTFINGYGYRDHVLIDGHVVVGRYSDGTPYPSAFWSDSRSCYSVVNGAISPWNCAL